MDKYEKELYGLDNTPEERWTKYSPEEYFYESNYLRIEINDFLKDGEYHLSPRDLEKIIRNAFTKGREHAVVGSPQFVGCKFSVREDEYISKLNLPDTINT